MPSDYFINKGEVGNMKKNTKQTKDDKMKKPKQHPKPKGFRMGLQSKDIGDIVANYHHYGYCNDCHCLQCFGERTS